MNLFEICLTFLAENADKYCKHDFEGIGYILYGHTNLYVKTY